MKTVLIQYGAGNTQSVKYALNRLGIEATLTDKPEEILSADKIIFPGVGQAASAMKVLKSKGLDKIIPGLKQDVLGICLGMQLMFQETQEGDTQGLNIIPGSVEKIPEEYTSPHTGWNQIRSFKSSLFKGIKEEAYMYFVHGYYLPLSPYTIAEVNYHSKFSAAVQKNNFYACQFHPEKSADAGQKIIENFLKI